MLSVRYRPAPVLKWLELGSASLRKGRERPLGSADFGRAIVDIVGRVFREGRGAVAEVAKKQIEIAEYRLFDDRLEVRGPFDKTIPYDSIRSIRLTRPVSFNIETTSGSVCIRPCAWLVVAGHKVPVGWVRDGMDVPFDLLAEELAARAKVRITRY